MENNVRATKYYQRQGNVNKLVTPEMRQQIRQVKHQLDEYDGSLSNLFDLLNDIREALNTARASAGCLLTDDPFEAWEKIASKAKKNSRRPPGDFIERKRRARRNSSRPQQRGEIDYARRCDNRSSRRKSNSIIMLVAFASSLTMCLNFDTFETALELGEDLLCPEPLETWDARKKRQEEAAAAGDEDLFDEF